MLAFRLWVKFFSCLQTVGQSFSLPESIVGAAVSTREKIGLIRLKAHKVLTSCLLEYTK
jgi:hypothetical protein